MDKKDHAKKRKTPTKQSAPLKKKPSVQIHAREFPQGRFLTRTEHRMIKAHDTRRTLNGADVDFIPILRDVLRKGTQVPVLRIKLGHADIISSAGGVVNTTFTMNLANAINSSAWDDVFDEFRLIRGYFEYVPKNAQALASASGTTVNSAVCVSIMDYDDSTPLSSEDGGWLHDNAAVFSFNTRHRMPLFQPDSVGLIQWLNCQTDQANGIAWMKFYASGAAASTTYGSVYGWIDYQFRST